MQLISGAVAGFRNSHIVSRLQADGLVSSNIATDNVEIARSVFTSRDRYIALGSDFRSAMRGAFAGILSERYRFFFLNGCDVDVSACGNRGIAVGFDG